MQYFQVFFMLKLALSSRFTALGFTGWKQVLNSIQYDPLICSLCPLYITRL